MAALPELADAATDQQSGGFQIYVDEDRNAAARLYILPQTFDGTLYDAPFGQRLGPPSFSPVANQYRVILESEPNFQLTPDALAKIYVKSSTGAMVPLSAIAHLKTMTAPLANVHECQLPAVTLSFNLSPGSSLGDAVDALQNAQREINLPNISTTFSGSAAEFRSSLKSEPYLLLAAIVVIYIVLGVLYESYIHPITILSSLPSAGVGALLAMLIFHQDLSLIALIGIILLIGIVKKNAIMMIDFALEAERHEGLPPEKSIYQACVILRFRPDYDELRWPRCWARCRWPSKAAPERNCAARSAFPLWAACCSREFLTLYTTPVIYLYLDRLGAWARKWRGSEAVPEPVVPGEKISPQPS